MYVAGFLSWVNGVWDACMSRAHGAWLTALLCWRLRWLCALLALAPGDEAARLRSEARTLLRRYNTISTSTRTVIVHIFFLIS